MCNNEKVLGEIRMVKSQFQPFRAAQSCALNRLVKADSKVEYFMLSLNINKAYLKLNIIKYQQGIFKVKFIKYI